MQRLAVTMLLCAISSIARADDPKDAHEAFREAVQRYQIFIVPHCAPEDVNTYVQARASRDRAFIQSLERTTLMADYRQAIAEQAERDSRTFYECAGPPPPPGSAPPDPVQLHLQHQKSLAAHFQEGDRQFETMVQLRDAFVGAGDK